MTPDSPATRGGILAVDDMPTNLQLLSALLRSQGHRVRPVPDGRAAIEAALAEPPELVLLDIRMPGMDGIEVCRRLKAEPALCDVPVIFLSGLTDTDEKVEAFSAGGVDYVTKPFHAEEIGARVATHLALRRLRERLEERNERLNELVEAQVRQILDSHLATIAALSRLAEYRDEETGNHIVRVQRYCELLARQLARDPDLAEQLVPGYVEDLVHAAPLHDIGKVGIPDAILLKKGPLTPDEFATMKTHTTLGARALEDVLAQYPRNAFLRMGVEIAGSHHERWDGTGYPEALAGEAIPLSARILNLVDQYDALRSARPYKPAFDAERTHRILTEGDGRTLPRHFDPRVLEAYKAAASGLDAVWTELQD